MKYFKFYSSDRNLYDFTFWASNIDEFNDPFEGRVQNVNTYEDNNASEVVGTMHRRAVVCLSHSEGSDFVKKSIQMWAHYANSHRGFCVEYNSGIFKGLKEKAPVNGYFDIDYRDELYPLDELKNISPEQFVSKVLGRKESKWSYESETRLIYRLEKNECYTPKGMLVPIAGKEKSIEAIYIGAKTSIDMQRRITCFTHKYNIPCYKMELSNLSYQLEQKQLFPTLTNYTPLPLDTTAIKLPTELEPLVEQMAKNVHEVWAAGRIADGWTYGATRDDAEKTHPCLMPYEELPESEKEYDRKTAIGTLKFILAQGFTINK